MILNELVILSLFIDIHNYSSNITSTNTSTSECIIIVIIIALRQHLVLLYIRVLLVFHRLPFVVSFLHLSISFLLFIRSVVVAHEMYSIYCACRCGIFFFQCYHNHHSLYCIYCFQWIVFITADGLGTLSSSCTTSFCAVITTTQVISIVVVAAAAAAAAVVAAAATATATATAANDDNDDNDNDNDNDSDNDVDEYDFAPGAQFLLQSEINICRIN